MKAKILVFLREKGDYVSGQELCGHFGVSRTAVWKAIGQLKKEGYCIEAVQNRGYRLLEEDAEIYGANELASRMRTKWMGRPAKFYESLGSTNIQAKMDAENGAGAGTLIVADMQTAGRGRRGRAWSSPAGTNIYYTLILKPDFAPEKAPMLTLLMAYAVAEGMSRLYARDIGGQDAGASHGLGIKWPNDIVINGKKVCGILTEMSLERDYIQYVVIGVGINVRQQEFVPEIAGKAACLEDEWGKRISRCTLIADIMEAFEEEYTRFCEEGSLMGLKEKYNALLVNKDNEVCVLDPKGEYRGTARGITDTGELLVELPDGQAAKVYAGEVSVRGIYGYV